MNPPVRQAAADELVDVMRLFDGALLETDSDRIRRQLTARSGCILLAGERRPLGAIALWTGAVDDRPTEWADAVHITAIAVATQRRDQGVGRSLIEAAADWAAPRPLSATFAERVDDFYTACGFEIKTHDGRLWAIRRAVVD